MDKFPSKDALVAGLSANLNATDNWDVVVSYSIVELGNFLKARWGGDSENHAFANVNITVDDSDRAGPFQQTFNLKLDAPKLSFATTGSAEARLEMPISGTFQYLGQGPDGSAYPVETIPDGQYLCIASVPLKAVTAKRTEGETVIVKADSSGKIIDFIEDPSAKVHIMFEFGAGASYSIEENPDQPAPQGAVNPFKPAVRAQLGGWMSELKYIQTLRYSLAVVTSTAAEVVGAKSTLTPESMTFVAYASRSDSSTTKGCLSVYMKVKDSGQNPGNATPMFKLPVSNAASYPIADGYTSSILIRHEVFASKFLVPSIAAHASISKVTSRSTTTGFGLDIKLNSSITAPHMSKDTGGTWGHYTFKVKDAKWDLGSVNVAFDVGVSAKASWNYTLEGQIEWTQYDNGPGGHYSDDLDGHVVFALDKKDQALFEKISDEELAARLKLDHADWQIKSSDKDNNTNPFSGHNKPPGDWVKEGLGKVDYPIFDLALALDYFAVSNVFAPGTRMIHAAGVEDVFTPHDVLILGNVVAAPAAPTDAAAVAVARTPVPKGGAPSAGSSSFPIKLPKTKSTADLMRDIDSGGPILELIFKALRDPKDPVAACDEVLECSEYSVVTSELPDLRKQFSAGPEFRVSRVAGVYKFTERKELSQQALTIYNNTNLYLGKDKTATPYTVDEAGKLSFESAGKTFTLEFHTEFDDGGLPTKKTFQGRVRPAADAAEPGVAVNGAEERDPDIVWANSLTRESFVGLVMALAIPFALAYVAHMEARREQEDEQRRQTTRDHIQAVIETMERAPTLEERLRRGVDGAEVPPEDLREVSAGELEKDGHVSDAMYEAMRRLREAEPDVTREKLRDEAREAARVYLEGRARSIVRTKIFAHLAQECGDVVDVMRQRIVNSFGVNDALTAIVTERVEARVKASVEADMALLQPGEEFFDAVAEAGWAEGEMERRDRELDGALSDVEKRLMEAELELKAAQEAEREMQRFIAESPNRMYLEHLQKVKDDLKKLRSNVEDAEKKRDRELKDRHDHKEAIEKLKDVDRADKERKAEDARKAAEHHRGSLAR